MEWVWVKLSKNWQRRTVKKRINSPFQKDTRLRWRQANSKKKELCPPRNSLLQWRMQLWHQSIKMSFRKRKKYFISYRDIFIRIPIIYRKILPVISLWQRCSMNLIKSLIRQDRKKRKSLVWLWKKFWFVHLFYRKKQNFRRNIRLSQALFRIVLIKRWSYSSIPLLYMLLQKASMESHE